MEPVESALQDNVREIRDFESPEEIAVVRNFVRARIPHGAPHYDAPRHFANATPVEGSEFEEKCLR